MGIKVFNPGGTEQKVADLLRKEEDLRDSYNIMFNIHGEYVKRPGTIADTSISDDYVFYTANGYKCTNITYIKSLDEYFYSDGFNYHAIRNGVDVTLFGNVGTDYNVQTSIQGAEYLNTFIFTHQSHQLGTYKYDGKTVYKAGLPAPTISNTTPGSLYLLSFFEFIDNKGNIIYGPATITPNVSNSTNVTFKTNTGTGFFSYDLLEINISSGVPIVLDKNNNTVTISGLSSFVAGDGMIIRNNSLPYPLLDDGVPLITISEQGGSALVTQDFFLNLKILSISGSGGIGSTVTFDPDSFQDRQITFSTTTPGVYNITHNTVLRMFTSTSETTGYKGYYSQASIKMVNSLTNNTRNITLNAAIDSVLLSDFYDITTDKLRPPKCKYILTFGYQLVYLQALSFWDFNNKEVNYLNNDLVMYSDTSNGDLGENISALNRQLIGDTYDGEITGGCRARDSLIVFKNRSIYAIDGVLVPGQYSMRKIETNEIGCLSQESVISTDGYILFQGQDGIYNINGYTCKKFSESLDVFFSDPTLDPSLTKSVVFNEKDKHMFFTNKGVAVFDYEFGKWFLWYGLSAQYGLIVNNDREIKMFRADNVYKFQIPLNDSGSSILAWYKTTWFHMNEPSVLKKATDLRTFSINNQGQTLQLTYYMDWSELKFKGPYPLDFSSASTKTVLRKLDIIQNQSFSFKVENNVLNEDLHVSGYEVVSGVFQTRDKNVK